MDGQTIRIIHGQFFLYVFQAPNSPETAEPGMIGMIGSPSGEMTTTRRAGATGSIGIGGSRRMTGMIGRMSEKKTGTSEKGENSQSKRLGL